MGLRIAPDAVDDLDSVYDGVLRRAMVLGAPTSAALVLLLVVLPGAEEPAAVSTIVLFSAILVLSFGSVAFLAPRPTGAEEAEQGDGCVFLPIRQGRHRLICAWAALVPLTGLAAVVVPDPDRRAGALLVGGLLMALTYLPQRLRRDLRLRLEPRGLAFRCPDLRERFVHWADIEDVLPDPGRSQFHLLLRRDRTVTLHLLRYQWRPSSIGEVIRYFAEHPEARAELTHVRALARFRIAAAAR